MSDNNHQHRILGAVDCLSIIIGVMIGSGIFFVPTEIAKVVPSPRLLLLVWVLSGILSLFGALTYAEISVLFPKAGAPYLFLRHAYGPFWGFLVGWALFWIIQTGSIAGVAVVFSSYLGYFLPLTPGGIKGVSVLLIGVLAGLNILSVRWGASVQNLLSALKVLALIILSLASFLSPRGDLQNLLGGGGLWPHHGNGWLSSPLSLTLLGGIGIGMIHALWAYDGWTNLTFMGGEIKEPRKTVPLSLVTGVFLVIVLYLLCNGAYLYILSVKGIAASSLVASETGRAVFGKVGNSLIVIMILFSTLGAVNGMIMTGPRIYYAMARDGLFFKEAAQIHPKLKTPVWAIGLQGIWASIAATIGSFSQILVYVMFASWLFYSMTAASIFVYRRREARLKDSASPGGVQGRASPGSGTERYRCWGYPFVPICFVMVSAWLVINALVERPVESGIGLGILLLALPSYWVMRRLARSDGTEQIAEAQINGHKDSAKDKKE